MRAKNLGRSVTSSAISFLLVLSTAAAEDRGSSNGPGSLSVVQIPSKDSSKSSTLPSVESVQPLAESNFAKSRLQFERESSERERFLLTRLASVKSESAQLEEELLELSRVLHALAQKAPMGAQGESSEDPLAIVRPRNRVLENSVR
jgi:hypothetical protein